LHRINPSFALRTGREQSPGWTRGCQSPIRRPVPTHQHCKGETQPGDDNVPKPSQTTDFSPGSASPGEQCGLSSSNGPEEHELLEAPHPNWAFNSNVASYITHRHRHLGFPRKEDVGLDHSVISWKDSHTPGWSCRTHSATSAFRDGLSVSNKSSSEQGNPSSTCRFWHLSCTSCCSPLPASPPATPGLQQGFGELFLCKSKPQEHPPVSLPLKLLSRSSTHTFGKGGGRVCFLLY